MALFTQVYILAVTPMEKLQFKRELPGRESEQATSSARPISVGTAPYRRRKVVLGHDGARAHPRRGTAWTEAA